MSRFAKLILVLVLTTSCVSTGGLSNFHFVTLEKIEIHPVLHNDNWIQLKEKKEEYFTDPDGTKVVWWQSTYYKHPTNPWFMGIHVIFGKSAMRAYSVKDKNGNYLKLYLALNKDGEWILVETDRMDFVPVENDQGMIVAIKLILLNNDNKVITSIKIERN